MADIIKRAPLAGIDEIESLADGSCMIVAQDGESYRFSIEKFREKYATTDYTKLENNPVTLITTEDYSASNLEDGHTYLIAHKNGTRINFGGTLSYGSQIFIDGNSATVICGQGTFFIPDINDTDYWGLADYCPALSEVESMISSIDMTDIDVSQALVKFKNMDKENLSLTLKEFANAMMEYFSNYDEQISAKQDEIQLGDGLKWDKGKLTLDIPDGDNLTYGTQAVEVNEVTVNE